MRSSALLAISTIVLSRTLEYEDPALPDLGRESLQGPLARTFDP